MSSAYVNLHHAHKDIQQSFYCEKIWKEIDCQAQIAHSSVASPTILFRHANIFVFIDCACEHAMSKKSERW